MAVLTDDMKQLIADSFAFIATVDENGNPQVGPKGTMRIFDDEHLIYNEQTGHQAWHNLQENHKIAVAFHPHPGMKGIRVEGHAVIHQGDQVHTDAQAYATENKLPDVIAAIVISVDRIVSLDAGPNAGIEIVNDPVK